VLGISRFGADFVASLLGAKRVGASPQALVGARSAALVGLFSASRDDPRPFVGAVAGELSPAASWQPGKVGSAPGWAARAAAVVKVVIAFLMIATFLAFYLLSR
jgi:uncharacterized protein YqgC (DUF456 family)